MVAGQIGQRLERLREVIAPGTDVADFVAASLTPAAQDAVDRLRDACQAAGPAFAAPLPRHLQCAQPIGFRLPQCAAAARRQACFRVDFEYFGWDDPAKAVADVMRIPAWACPRDWRSAIDHASRRR